MNAGDARLEIIRMQKKNTNLRTSCIRWNPTKGSLKPNTRFLHFDVARVWQCMIETATTEVALAIQWVDNAGRITELAIANL